MHTTVQLESLLCKRLLSFVYQNNPYSTLDDRLTTSIIRHPYKFLFISSKSRLTSKSHHPQNVAACFCQLIPINAALDISPHGKGSPVHAHYTHIQIGLLLRLCMCMHVDLCRRRPRNLAALELPLHLTRP